jgi:hypothetical protein
MNNDAERGAERFQPCHWNTVSPARRIPLAAVWNNDAAAEVAERNNGNGNCSAGRQ